MKSFKGFTGLYQVQKTLRFELKPKGKTMDNFMNSGLLKQDEHRADSYKKVKKIIDRYHKAYIEKVLQNFQFKYDDKGNKDSLSEYFKTYNNDNKNTWNINR